jgi:hypothetical protein
MALPFRLDFLSLEPFLVEIDPLPSQLGRLLRASPLLSPIGRSTLSVRRSESKFSARTLPAIVPAEDHHSFGARSGNRDAKRDGAPRDDL